jgi:glycosyltransferase involved in cell wall biosynthesis
MEGLSLALLDAMGARVCVLTSDIPENVELVEGAGYTFRKGDVNDLQRMLQLLIHSPKLREDAARAAHSRIQGKYLWPVIAQQIEFVYRGIMRKPMATCVPQLPNANSEKLKNAA